MQKRIVADRFELGDVVATGGMGLVYRALDSTTGEPVAVKLLTATGKTSLERFEREARVLAQLRHASIVRYVAHGSSDLGEPFIAMEWLDGVDLGAHIAQHGALPLDECVSFAIDIAHALAFAHERGIVHRDIKPSNVFLEGGDTRRIKVLDFGIARVAHASLLATRTGATVGTPGYMAPEQVRGERDIDARADVFSLGAVLFECVTGSPPFRGDNVMAILAKILLEQPPRPSEILSGIPPALDELCARMLAGDRDKRVSSALAVRDALANLGTLGYSVRPRPAVSDALTSGEQRIISVLLLGAIDETLDERTAPTVVGGAGPIGDIRRIAATHGGEAQALFGGATVVRMAGAAADQARAIARCALELREAMGRIPMALASAPGDVTARLPTAAAIDRAATLIARGDHQGVRIDDVTAGLLAGRFEIVHAEHGLVLGTELRTLEPRRLFLGRATPCVGRTRDLDALGSTFAACVEEHSAAVVLVTAPAGIGKSRLRYEIVSRIEAEHADAQIWIARGDLSSAGSALGMIAQATKHAMKITDGEALSTRQQKIGAHLRRRLDAESAASAEEFIGELVGAPFAGEGSVQLRAARADDVLMGDRIRSAWEEWALAEVEHGPLLVVLEDLHWGDWPSIRLVDSLLGSAKDKSLMVLALARPEVTSLFPQMWGERALTHIQLRALSAKAGAELVREALPSVDDATVARIVERADGNAFFLEELIRAVADGREADLPETVLAVMQDRLERLEPEARRALRAGAVFGEIFYRSGALELCGDGDGAWIDRLVERELVTPRARSRFPGESSYVFRHALVQEAAYAMLTEADRATGHRIAAEWLERTGEQDASVLAMHFERGRVLDRAAHYYLRAARAAFLANDHDSALERAAVAERCSPETEPGELALLRATVERWRGNFATSEDHARAAMERLEHGSAAWFEAAAHASWSAGKLAHKEQLLAVARAIASSPPSPGAEGKRAAALAEAGTQAYFSGNYADADMLIGEIDALESALADPGVRAVVLRARAYRAWFHRDLGATLAGIEASARAFEQAGDRRNLCVQSAALGYCAMELGAYEEAEPALRDAIETAERMGLGSVAAVARQNLGMVRARRGAFDEALRIEEQSIRELEKQGDRRMAAASHIYRAEILALADRIPEADEQAAATLERSGASPPVHAHALATAARIALRANDAPRSSRLGKEAEAMLDSVSGIGEGELLIRLAVAESALASGDVEAARRSIARGASELRERAAMIADERRRASFLAVPENALLLALEREHSV